MRDQHANELSTEDSYPEITLRGLAVNPRALWEC